MFLLEIAATPPPLLQSPVSVERGWEVVLGREAAVRKEGAPPGFPGMSTPACWRCYLAGSTRAARRAEQRLTCVSHVAPAATSAGTASVTSPLPTSPHLQPLAQFQSGPGQLATGWESQRSCPSSNVNRLGTQREHLVSDFQISASCPSSTCCRGG